MNTNKFEEKIYNAGQKIGLTFDEREAMRARLLSGITASEQNTSPYSFMFYWRFVSFYVKPQYVSFALVAVLLVSGVSLAAEKSLPGEPLYQVKTSVNENVLGLFAFTPQSKAQLHTELAVRRLEEVEKLAMAGKLDATTTAEAEHKIDSNLVVIKDSVKQLETENNSVAAADTSSRAESSLKVHEAILDTIADGNTAVQDVANKVGIQATALSLDRAGMDSRNSSTTLSIDTLLDQQKIAQQAIAFLQSALATTSATSSEIEASSTVATDATSTDTFIVKVQARLQNASDFLAQGSKKLDIKDYGEAFVLFKKAEKEALDARNVLEVGDVPEVIPVKQQDVATSTATSTQDSNVDSKIDTKTDTKISE